MIQFLARKLIRDYQNTGDCEVRRAYGVLCSTVGILLNLMLFALKALAGVISGSIAITADAFNNLSDAGSSVVTLLGFKLAAQKPDSDHPFGHGRMEYISGLVVSMVILLMAFELGKSSVEKIISPAPVAFDPLVAAILLVSIAVKVYMSLYNRTIGKKVNSAAMTATAKDSLSDCLATTAALLATLAGYLWNISIDGWCGLVVSFFILWAGISAARDTISPLLGQPPEPEFVQHIQQLVMSYPDIIGIHDLIVHDYGPGRCFVSLHAEVPASGDIIALHDVVDTVEKELNNALSCLTTIHMDPVVNDGGLTLQTRQRVQDIVRMIDPAINIHDFRMVAGPTHTNVIFDAVVPHNFPLSDREVADRIRSGVRALDGNYFAVVEVEKSYI